MNVQNNDQDLAMRQYELLREEILAADAQNYKITAGVFTASSVILLTGFKQIETLTNLSQYWLCFGIFMTSLVVSIPGYSLILGNRKRIWRVATYMTTFLEPLLSQVKWESREIELRRITDQSTATAGSQQALTPRSSRVRKVFRASSNVIENEIRMMVFFTAVAVCGLVLSALGILEWLGFAPQSISHDLFFTTHWKFLAAAPISLIVGLLGVQRAARDSEDHSRTGHIRRSFEDGWLAVKEQEITTPRMGESR